MDKNSYSGYFIASENTDIVHYGIKGQQWGERRFQNKDGSLTPAGKIRYSSGGKVGEAIANKQYVTKKQDVYGGTSYGDKIRKTVSRKAYKTKMKETAAYNKYLQSNKSFKEKTIDFFDDFIKGVGSILDGEYSTKKNKAKTSAIVKPQTVEKVTKKIDDVVKGVKSSAVAAKINSIRIK